MKKLGLLVVLAACGAKAQPGAVDNHVAPAGPSPTVAWGENGFATTDLPAIASDGTTVVYAHQGEDGGRGFANMEIVVKDTHDQKLRSHQVMQAPDDAEEPIDPTPEQIAAANQFLAEGQWIALAAPAGEIVGSDPDEGPVFSESATATIGTLEIGFGNSGRVTVRDGGIVVHDSAHPDWLAKDYAIDAEITCSNPPYLGAAWVAADRHVALLKVSYVGNDTCWEPDSEEHVVVW